MKGKIITNLFNIVFCAINKLCWEVGHLLGSSEVGVFQAPRNGTKDDGKFTNLSSNIEYFLILTKGTDGNSIKGSILAYE